MIYIFNKAYLSLGKKNNSFIEQKSNGSLFTLFAVFWVYYFGAGS